MEDSYVLQLLKPKFKDFHLCFCGFAECKPLHSYGPAARPNYILHYVMKGKGIYQVGETKYQLKEGQVFLIEPESLTFYQADKTDPWSYLWVGFGGTEAQRFVRVEPYVILSGVSGRFLSDHSATSSGCTSDKILLILNPLLPLRLASLYWESVDWYSLR